MHLERKSGDSRVRQEALIKTVKIGIQLRGRERGILVDDVLDGDHSVDAPRPARGLRNQSRRQHKKTQGQRVPSHRVAPASLSLASKVLKGSAPITSVPATSSSMIFPIKKDGVP